MNPAIHPAHTHRSANPAWHLLLCFVCLLTFSIPALHAETIPLDQHWEYRWGDSPFKDDTPLWAIEPDAAQWQAIDFPSNPPGRNNRENIWYRTLIPQGDWRDPVLYIFSVDLIVEAYLDGKQIYHYGQFDTKGQGTFEGWPWHMISLPPDAAGKPIYFRVYSNYLDIGLWGEVKIMDRLKLYQQILHESIDGLLITTFSLLVAFLTLLFALLKTDSRRLLAALGLFSLASAGLAISGSQAKQLLIHQPLMWEYIGAGSYYLLPVALAMILQSWFDRLQWLFRGLATLFTAYFIGALSLALAGVVSLANTYPVFDLLFALLVPIMLLGSMRLLPTANTDQRIMLFTTAAMTILLILDMAVAHNWIPWGRVPVGWGSLIFSLAIVMLSLRHFLHTQQAIIRLNTTLESRVTERTHELEMFAHREADRARALEFSSRKRAMLDDLVVELEQQEGIALAMDLFIARLPSLCNPISGGIYEQDAQHWRLIQGWGEIQLPQRQLSIGEAQPADTLSRFLIQYDDPRKGRKQIAWLVLDLERQEANLEDLTPLTLHMLFTRAVERINLTLSKIVLQQALSRFSYEDALTGLNNRRYLDEMLSREIALAHRTQSPLALMICDIDHFKQLNDTHGHAAGDEVLKEVARWLRKTFRDTDIICRYGGEEFVVVMPAASMKDCHERSEQLRSNLETLTITLGTDTIGPATLSAGISALSANLNNADDLLRRADEALYQAKASGRNRIICTTDDTDFRVSSSS